MARFAPPDLWSDRDDDYYDDEPHDTCDHEDSETDVCTGRVVCQICGHRWWATQEEVDAELDRMVAYDKWAEQENRRQWWADLRYRVFWPFYRLRAIWIRWTQPDPDDDIPF